MKKETSKIVHYYVQVRKNQTSRPEIVYHTINSKKNEYYHLFINKSQAVELMNKEKKLKPNDQFRVVKSTQTYSSDGWI